MVAPIFQESAFVWACVTLAGGCLAVAVAVRTRHFLHELSEQFIRLPPSGKAVFVAAVVVATVFAQKPTNVSTNQPESARAEEGVSATLAEGMPTASDTCAEETQGVSEGRSQSDSEHSELPARAREETEGGRHGEGFEGGDPTVASTTPANSPCLSNSVTSVLSVADTPPLSSNDVVRGYRLEMVRTNEAISYTRPTNARLVGTWHLTDAYRGRAWVLLGDEGKGKREKGRSADGQLLPSSLFLFPLGPHVVTSLWAHTWGKARPQLRNASNEIFVIGAPMFARHDQSYLWTAATANGSVLLTWENFFLGNPYEREVATDSHGLAQIGDGKPTVLNTEGIEERRHGGGLDGAVATVASATPTNPPCLTNSGVSCPLARPSGSPSAKVPSETLCVSAAHVFSESNPLVVHPPITAQLELFPNGDFIARSNSVERVYRRVNPDDWDDDGIPNGADDAPLVPSDTPQFGPHQTLPEGANADAYCWVDLVVRQANAQVTFTGDGASNLADPSFIAEADATNRVTLLIGKTYCVTCPMPFEVAAKSSDDIEDSWEEDRRALWLHWPVAIHSHGTSEQRSVARTEMRSHGAASTDWHGLTRIGNDLLSTFVQTYAKTSRLFTMQVIPSGLGGAFTWTNVCCRISGSDYTFSITCGDSCSCGGCSATGYLEYEGYRLPAYGGFCGCSGSVDHPGDDQDPDKDPPLPGASATFSKRVVFFEDEYENAPGETVPWRSTETELDCWAYGGTRGGHVRIEIQGADGLVQYGGRPLPFEQDLEPGEEVTFKNTYRAVSPSGGEDDIVVTATFTENETDWSQTTIDKATAVKVTVKPRVLAPENESLSRHKFGIGEIVDCENQPKVESVRWKRNGGGTLKESNGSYEYRCPLSAEVNGFEIAGEGCSYVPRTRVVEPQGVLARDAGYTTAPKIRSGQAGGILLTIDLYVLPLDVSFSGIRIEEIPDVGGSHSGYFADTFFMSEWFHGEDEGAGDWREVYGNNKFLNDEAGFKRALPQLDSTGFVSTTGTNGWANGNLTWEVPCGWADSNVQKGDDPIGTFANGSRQVMTIDAQGNVEVQKHGNAVRREISGGIILNGVRVQ